MEGLKKGAWCSEEGELLIHSVKLHGEGKWRSLAQKAGLSRSGRSCRLRWLNYLRPGIKRGDFSADEEELIIKLHRLLGNRWVLIAGRLPGRTDNEIKNYWNTILVKRIRSQTQQSDHSKLSEIRRFQSHTAPNISEVQARDHEEVGFSVGQSLSHSSRDVPENDFHSFNFGSWNENNNFLEIEDGEETEPMRHMELKTIASLLDIEKELRELL